MLYTIRTFKADCYRILRSKLFYVTLLLGLGYSLSVLIYRRLGLVFSTPEIDIQMQQLFEAQPWNADTAQYALLSQVYTLSIFMIPLVYLVIGKDINDNMYKHHLTTGITRTQYFITKLSILYILSGAILCLYFLITYIASGFLFGFEINEMGQIIVLLLVKHLYAIVNYSIALIFLYATTSFIPTALSIVILPIIVQVLYLFYNVVLRHIPYLNLNEMMSLAGIVAPLNIPNVLIIGVLLLTIATSCSIMIINKKDY